MTTKERHIAGRIIDLYARDKMSEEVLQRDFLAFLSSDVHTKEKDEALTDLWNKVNRSARSSTYQSLAQVMVRLDFPERQRRFSTGRLSWKIAAVLVPVLAIAGAYLWTDRAVVSVSDVVAEEIAVSVAAGNQEYVVLPDGSQVWVRGGSHITYDGELAKERVIRLTGEAFFKVRKDSKPFLVKTEHAVVRALGTEFNVCAFAGEEKVLVSLKSGKVEIAVGVQKYVMNPGEQLTFHPATAETKIELIAEPEARTENPDWVKGALSFDHNSLDEIFRTCERHFGVKISAAGTVVGGSYSTRFNADANVEEVLAVLQELSGRFDYQIKEEEVLVVMR